MRRALAVALPILAAALYLPALRYGFALDDRGLVAWNPHLSSLRDLPYLFSHDLAASSRLEGVDDYYRPLAMASLLINKLVLGESPWGFHLVNALLHAACVAAIMALARRIAGWRAAIGAGMVLAFHPLAVEGVAWITGRNDTLVVAAMLAAMWAAAAGKPLVVFAATLAALFTKETAVMTVPLVAAAALAGKKRVWPALAAAAAALLPWIIVRALAGIPSQAWLFAPARWGVLARSYAAVLEHAAGAILVGRGLSPFAPVAVPGWGEAIAVLLAAAAVLVAVRRIPLVALGLFTLLASLVPHAVLPSHAGYLGDRYLYLPLAGAALAAGGLVELWLTRAPAHARVAALAGATAAVLLAAAALGREADWRDEDTILAAVLRDDPNNRWALLQQGADAYMAGDPARAWDRYSAVVGEDPTSHVALANLAALAMDRRDFAGARAFSQRALAARPGYAFGELNLGHACLELGDLPCAEQALSRLLAGSPHLTRALLLRGVAYARDGRFDDARRDWEAIPRGAPEFAGAAANLGKLPR